MTCQLILGDLGLVCDFPLSCVLRVIHIFCHFPSSVALFLAFSPRCLPVYFPLPAVSPKLERQHENTQDCQWIQSAKLGDALDTDEALSQRRSDVFEVLVFLGINKAAPTQSSGTGKKLEAARCSREMGRPLPSNRSFLLVGNIL